MIGVVSRASLRHFRRHPTQLGLAVLGIALGVALAVGIDVASASVQRAFALGSQAITGRATHQIVGGPSGIDEAVYRRLRLAPDRPAALALAPVVLGNAVPERGGGVLQLLGVDLLAEDRFRPTAQGPGLTDRGTLRSLLVQPGTTVLSMDTAARLGIGVGGVLPIRVGARRLPLTVVQVRVPRDDIERRGLDGLAIVDVATAQELLVMLGRLSRIDVRVDGDGGPAALAWLAARVPPDARIEPAPAQAGALGQVTRAFDLNLRALSLLALLVGAFLIFNTMTFSVVQRRPVLAILRTLGAERAQLGRHLLAEGLAFGVVGSALGVALGVALSRRLVLLVARAVSDLYFAVSVTDVPLPVPALVRGFGLGVLVAVLTSWPAARDATTTQPHVALQRSTLETGLRRRLPRLTALGLTTIAAAVLLLLISGSSVGAGLLALVVLLIGCAALAPVAVLAGARVLGAGLAAVLGPTGRLAARSIGAGLSRTGVATAALALALAVTTGMALMVLSFRGAVERWLEGTLRADVYVSAPATVSARAEVPLPPTLVERVRRTPGVAAAGTNRLVTVDSDGTSTLLLAVDLPPDRHPGVELLTPAPPALWNAFAGGGVAFISEPLAFKRHLKLGDALPVTTDRGRVTLPIAAIYRDYGSDAGVVMISGATYRRRFDDRLVTAVALFAAPGVSADDIVARVRAGLTGDDAVLVRSNRALREASLQIFDRTFEVTSVLRLFALIVAAFGVASALMAVALERGRERATLRALGATPGQVAQISLLETGLLGTLAGLLAMPIGTALATVLVFVINRRSFGWTMPLDLDTRTLLTAPLLGLVAGVAAGVYPAWRAARVVPAQALREE